MREAGNEMPGFLTEYGSRARLEQYGIPFVEAVLTQDVDAAIDAAGRWGYPVALKVMAPSIVHKSDAGVVALNVRSDDELRQAFDRIMTAAQGVTGTGGIEGVTVQPMAPAGTELIVGARRSEEFGPVCLVGLGGIWAEILEDTALALCPVGADDALDMLQQLRAWPALQGARGRPALDVPAICSLIVSVSNAMVDDSSLSEMDLNPVFAFEAGRGVLAVDARVKLS